MKIGFLGMSGIRPKDERLLELGLTLPGFVDRSTVVAPLPSLGLLSIAACTPRSHELIYREAPCADAVPRDLFDCDLVAVSSLSAPIHEAYQVCDALRSAGVRVAIGGLHVSSLPDEAKQHADDVVVGEGENVWPHVVEAVTRGDAGRIWRASCSGPVDVAALPVPRYDLLAGRPYNRFTVQTSRGCPWRCDFCASSVMLREKYRKRPVIDVSRDICELIRLFGDRFIEFADENTFVDKRWGRELCREILPLGVKWFPESNISVAEDPELLRLMRASGCRQILVGLESPNAVALEGVEMRSNFKARMFSRYGCAIEVIQSHGITVNGCFILGLDSLTPDVFLELFEFAESVGLYEVQITVLTAFPGTPLYRRLHAEGRLLAPTDRESCTLFDVNFQPKQMSPDELREGLYWLSERLYSRSAVRRRRKLFFEQAKGISGTFGFDAQDCRRAA